MQLDGERERQTKVPTDLKKKKGKEAPHVKKGIPESLP